MFIKEYKQGHVWMYYVRNKHNVNHYMTLFFLFGHACAWISKQKNRQLYLKELSPLSLPRNTTYTLIFSAQGEYIYKYIFIFICVCIYISFNRAWNPSFFSFFWQIVWICSVIFGMLIALPITLVYYILLGLWKGWIASTGFGIH